MNFVYTLKRSKRKSIGIKINYEGQIIVSAPIYATQKHIEYFLNEKSLWINKSIALIKAKAQRFNNSIHLKTILFNGKEYSIIFAKTKKPLLSIDDNVFYLPMRLCDKPQQLIIKNIKNWYIQQAQIIIKNELLDEAEYFPKKINSLKITNTKSRWGSCDRKNNICINFRALMLPKELRQYLLVHELSHMVYFNHSKEFWLYLSKHLPDFQKKRAALKNYDFLQTLYR